MIIRDDRVPLAGAAAVLGARRTPGGAVLGARRSPGTGDMSNAAAMMGLMGTATTALGAWALAKRKRDEDLEEADDQE